MDITKYITGAAQAPNIQHENIPGTPESNTHAPAKQPGKANGAVKYSPEVDAVMPKRVTGCALTARGEGTCMSRQMAERVSSAVGVNGTPAEIVSQAREKLGCDTERCVLEKLEHKLGPALVRAEIQISYKVDGPTGTTLLSNYNIDSVLEQWAAVYKDFYHYYFHMLDYATHSISNRYVVERPSAMATIDWTDLYNGAKNGVKYRTSGCVINSDIYSGPGKHWMCLFVDARGPTATVEFFNPSGNAPQPEWVNWMVKTKNQLSKFMPAETVIATRLMHQRSKTECGAYSLFYIWARLHGLPHEYFAKNRVPDEAIFEFKQHLYDSKNGEYVFDFAEYSRRVNIKWA